MRAARKQKCKNNFQKALKYIHEAEIKYGSIAKTPKDALDLKKARKFLNVKPDKYDTDLDLRIKELIEYGYPAGAIYQVLNVNQFKVQKVREFYKLKFKPIFKYQLSKGNYTGYTPYVKGMCKIAQIGMMGTSNSIIEKIQRLGYTIKRVALYWGDLPNGAVYATRDSRLMQKHGNNSYLKDEYKKQTERRQSDLEKELVLVMSKDKLFKKLMTANDYPYAIEVWADSVTFTKEQKKWIKSKLQNEGDAKMLDHIFQRVYGTGYQTAIETTMDVST